MEELLVSAMCINARISYPLIASCQVSLPIRTTEQKKT